MPLDYIGKDRNPNEDDRIWFEGIFVIAHVKAPVVHVWFGFKNNQVEPWHGGLWLNQEEVVRDTYNLPAVS